MKQDKYLNCNMTEIPTEDFPELFQFYRYFPEKYPFLLSTTSQNNYNDLKSSFNILFIEPKEWLKLDHALQLTASPQYDIHPEQSFLDNFDRIFNAEKSTSKVEFLKDVNLPFTGGWFVFFAYELAQQIEPCLNLPLFDQKEEQSLPVAYAARVRSALIFDHKNNKIFLLTESDVNHQKSFEKLLEDVQFIHSQSNKDDLNDIGLMNDLEEEKDNIFTQGVKKVKDYIKEGDVFQVNLSRYWQTSINNNVQDTAKEGFSKIMASLYKLLSQVNPAPFSGLACFSDKQGRAGIISSSPERLLKVKNNQLESRPIAGTRPRSESLAEDLRLIEELHQHPKEQAEHIMLIDLIRNDLGKVCVPGTVEVNELMVNETYAHVHHIVSNVIGQLQNGITPGDVIKALFPGGTITGCPKVRCMEIIAELEKQPRGAYTGSMGYINLEGSMDLNILIRSMVLQKSSSSHYHLGFRAGAGLVYDSIADKELQETRDKAMGLIRALQ